MLICQSVSQKHFLTSVPVYVEYLEPDNMLELFFNSVMCHQMWPRVWAPEPTPKQATKKSFEYTFQ